MNYLENILESIIPISFYYLFIPLILIPLVSLVSPLKIFKKYSRSSWVIFKILQLFGLLLIFDVISVISVVLALLLFHTISSTETSDPGLGLYLILVPPVIAFYNLIAILTLIIRHLKLKLNKS